MSEKAGLSFYISFRASKCDYWTDAKVRHCNAYHTKDGLWRFIREKYKERKAKKENLLAIKRDLHEVNLTYVKDINLFFSNGNVSDPKHQKLHQSLILLTSKKK